MNRRGVDFFFTDFVVNVGDERHRLVGVLLDARDVVERVQERDAGVSLACALSVDLQLQSIF